MSPDSKSGRVSRRKLVERAAVAASALPLMGSLLQAQAPAQPPAGAPAAAGGPAGAGRGRGGGRGPGPGGTGPIRVLFISRFHPFNREPLFLTLDSFGKDITWTHVEHPAAEVFFSPETSKNFDVFLRTTPSPARSVTRNRMARLRPSTPCLPPNCRGTSKRSCSRATRDSCSSITRSRPGFTPGRSMWK